MPWACCFASGSVYSAPDEGLHEERRRSTVTERLRAAAAHLVLTTPKQKSSSHEFVLVKNRRRGSVEATNFASMERRVRQNAKTEKEAEAKLHLVKQFVKQDTITLRFTQDELNGLISLFEMNAVSEAGEMVVTREKFGEIFGVDGLLMDFLFEHFDADGGGSLDLREFLIGFDYWKKELARPTRDKVRVFYALFDKDKNGKMDRSELSRMLAYILKLGVEHGESNCSSVRVLSDMFFQDMDADGDGFVTFEEFRQYAAGHQEIMSTLVKSDEVSADSHLRECFARFDKDSNGVLDRDEFREMMLMTNLHAKEESEALCGHLDDFAERVFAEVDLDGSGLIDFSEYRDWMDAHPESTSWISDISTIVSHTTEVLNAMGALRFDHASSVLRSPARSGFLGSSYAHADGVTVLLHRLKDLQQRMKHYLGSDHVGLCPIVPSVAHDAEVLDEDLGGGTQDGAGRDEEHSERTISEPQRLDSNSRSGIIRITSARASRKNGASMDLLDDAEELEICIIRSESQIEREKSRGLDPKGVSESQLMRLESIGESDCT